MPYIIETWDKPDYWNVRQQARQAHLEYLAEIAPTLLACGAKLNDDGSDAGGGVYVVDVDSREEAQAIIAADPFTHAELFERIEIKRWRKAYLDGKCCL